MTVEIRSNYLVSCENEPVEKLFEKLQKDFPQLNPISEQTLQLREENKILSRDNEYAMRRIEELTRERDELQRKFEGAGVLNDRLKDLTRPALPEGMRLAEHPEYGMVVVSPEADFKGYYRVFAVDKSGLSKAFSGYSDPSDLTFLDEEPAPLPKPEDCKVGELYLAKVFGREFVATRCGTTDERYPWVVFKPDNDYSGWCSDEHITLLSRFLPDR